MTVFLSIIITSIICIYFLKVSPVENGRKIYSNYKFDDLKNKSNLKDPIDKLDLISFRHEFGETIFELQKEIEFLREELDNLKCESLNNKK